MTSRKCRGGFAPCALFNNKHTPAVGEGATTEERDELQEWIDGFGTFAFILFSHCVVITRLHHSSPLQRHGDSQSVWYELLNNATQRSRRSADSTVYTAAEAGFHTHTASCLYGMVLYMS